MRNQKIYTRPKRTTFLKLFAKGLITSVIATAIFSGVLFEVVAQSTFKNIESSMMQREAEFLSMISKREAGEINAFSQTLNGYMSLHTSFIIEDYNENSFAVSTIEDENGTILYSSKERLGMVIKFIKADSLSEVHPENGWYTCETEEIPEIYQEYQKLNAGIDPVNDYVRLQLQSAYVDKKNHRFVPHQAELQIYHHDKNDPWKEPDVIETKAVTCDFQNDDYELVTLNSSIGENVPYGIMANFWGTKNFDAVASSNLYFHVKGQYFSTEDVNLSTRRFSCSAPVWVDGQKAYLKMAYQVDVWNPENKAIFFKAIYIFFLCMILINLFWSLHKNKINQLNYQFEDYQRTLTNNLAHDLKTPLMAINGYAENLLTSYRMEDQPRKYLESILESVGYTDMLINKTLELNQIQEISTLKKSKVNLHDLTEQIIHRYQPRLDECGFRLHLEGDAQIAANPDMIRTCIDNLLSNAVKYAVPGSEIKIIINKKKFSISNEIIAPVETKCLLLPFVKGDEARSDKNSSGLGLSIAQNAAEINGFRLEIDSKNQQFTAAILF